jgi:hypothetical protein
MMTMAILTTFPLMTNVLKSLSQAAGVKRLGSGSRQLDVHIT